MYVFALYLLCRKNFRLKLEVDSVQGLVPVCSVRSDRNCRFPRRSTKGCYVITFPFLGLSILIHRNTYYNLRFSLRIAVIMQQLPNLVSFNYNRFEREIYTLKKLHFLQ